MLTKREAAEINIKAQGLRINGSLYCNPKICPFYRNPCDSEHHVLNRAKCVNIGKEWLKHQS